MRRLGSRKTGWDPVKRFNQTSWVAIVSPTDRPKLVRNRCVIEVFCGVFMLSCCFFGFFCECRGVFVIRLSQIYLFLFLLGLNQISSLFSYHKGQAFSLFVGCFFFRKVQLKLCVSVHYYLCALPTVELLGTQKLIEKDCKDRHRRRTQIPWLATMSFSMIQRRKYNAIVKLSKATW